PIIELPPHRGGGTRKTIPLPPLTIEDDELRALFDAKESLREILDGVHNNIKIPAHMVKSDDPIVPVMADRTERTSRANPPRYLGLILDGQRRRAAREGLTPVAEFKGKNIAWNLLEMLAEAGDAYSPLEELEAAWEKSDRDKPGTDRLYPEISKLRNIIKPLGI